MFRLRIETGNAAFSENAGEEIARILREFAAVCETHAEPPGNAKLYDINGNAVGRVLYIDHDHYELWLDDEVQFPRLISEIFTADEISDTSLGHIRASMDIDSHDLQQLIRRAEFEWSRLKKAMAEEL